MPSTTQIAKEARESRTAATRGLITPQPHIELQPTEVTAMVPIVHRYKRRRQLVPSELQVTT